MIKTREMLLFFSQESRVDELIFTDRFFPLIFYFSANNLKSENEKSQTIVVSLVSERGEENYW